MPKTKHETIRTVSHPLLHHKLTHMRKSTQDTPNRAFSQLMREAGAILACEATREMELGASSAFESEGTGEMVTGSVLKGPKPVIVTILRSGLVMAEGVRDVIPTTFFGHIGIHHALSHKEEVEYFFALPNTKTDENDRKIFIIDPVIVSGKTAVRAVDSIKNSTSTGVAEHNIFFLTFIVGKDGGELIRQKCPDITVYTAVDEERVFNNDVKPGIGVISNRLFRTA